MGPFVKNRGKTQVTSLCINPFVKNRFICVVCVTDTKSNQNPLNTSMTNVCGAIITTREVTSNGEPLDVRYCTCRPKYVREDGTGCCGRHRSQAAVCGAILNNPPYSENRYCTYLSTFVGDDGTTCCGLHIPSTPLHISPTTRVVDECAICLSDCLMMDCHTTSCNHAFHNHCIHRWFSTGGNSCPICRTVLTNTNSERILERLLIYEEALCNTQSNIVHLSSLEEDNPSFITIVCNIIIMLSQHAEEHCRISEDISIDDSGNAHKLSENLLKIYSMTEEYKIQMRRVILPPLTPRGYYC